jgi:drug/metabolite transporter (DMT)-like permease
MKPSSAKVILTFLLLILTWGTTWAAVRLSLEGFAPMTSAAVRFALAVFLLFVWARLSGRAILPNDVVLPRHRLVWGVQAVFNFLIPYSLTYWAEQWVPSGLVAVLFSTFPMFVMLIAFFVLPEERLGPAGVLGMGLGFAGIAVIYSADLTALAGPEAAFAAVVFLLSPLSAACGQVVVKRWGDDLSPLSLTLVPMALATVMLGSLAAVLEGDRAMEPTAMAIGAVLYLALVGTALAFTLYFWLLKHVTATELSLITYATPVVAVALGTLWLDEPLTLRLVVGGLLVIGGMGLAARRKKAQ